jgi:glycosyltransferase involved in cell wall biosynthesis
MYDPLVSIVLPVYNSAPFLHAAIVSILDQTLSSFELIVVDDCSTDGSLQIAKEICDPRIRILENRTRLGLVGALNLGFSHSQGRYIARMDADDICLPDRIAEQVAFMNANPSVAVCGTWFRYFGKWSWVNKKHPLTHDDIKNALLAEGCVIAHPTVMIRSDVIRALDEIYEQEFANAEDYRLWARLALQYKINNLGQVLLLYRVHPHQVSQVKSAEQQIAAARVRAAFLAEVLPASSSSKVILQRIFESRNLGPKSIEELRVALMEARMANERVQVFRPRAVARASARIWLDVLSVSQNWYPPSRELYFPILALKVNAAWRKALHCLFRIWAVATSRAG